MSGFAIASGIGFDYANFYPTNLDNCKLWLDATDIGVQGYSLDFDGVDDYVQATNVITSYPFTLECWVRFDVVNSNDTLISINSITAGNTTTHYSIRYSGGANQKFGVRSADFITLGTTTPLANVWYHVAGVFESATSRTIYVNGIAEGTGTNSSTFDSGMTYQVRMGNLRVNTPTDFLDGKLSDVRIWNTARTAQQIADNYNKRLIGNETGLVGYWKLDEGNTTTVTDSTSNANTGTISGALWTDLEPFTEQPTDTQGVRSWKDKSGNGYNATQATSANRPTFRTNQINGKPAVIFDGTNDKLTITGSTSTFKFLHSDVSTVFIVARAGSVSNPDTLYCFIGNNGLSFSSIGYDVRYDDRSSSSLNNMIRSNIANGGGTAQRVVDNLLNNSTLTPNVYHILRISSDPTNSTDLERSIFQIDNGSLIKTNVYTATVSTSNASNNLTLGASTPTTTSFNLNGAICEVIIYNRLLSAGEIQQMHNYLKSKWDL